MSEVETEPTDPGRSDLANELSIMLQTEFRQLARSLQSKLCEELRSEIQATREAAPSEEPASPKASLGSRSRIGQSQSQLRASSASLTEASAFQPHVWQTRHIRRYCQVEVQDEYDETGIDSLHVSRPMDHALDPPTGGMKLRRSATDDLSSTGKDIDTSLWTSKVQVGPQDAMTSREDEADKAERALPGQMNLPDKLQGVAEGVEDDSMEQNPSKKESIINTRAISTRGGRKSTVAERKIEMAMGLSTETSRAQLLQQQAGWSRMRRRMDAIVRSQSFEYIVVLIIVVHTALVGVQIDYMAKSSSATPPIGFRAVDLLFCVFFAVEVVMRMIVHQLRFFYMWGWGWNVIDLTLVVAQVVEEFLTLASAGDDTVGGGINFTVLRVIRMLRCVRIVRILRLTRFFDDLRRLVACVIYSVKSFVWSFLFVFLLVYIYGIYLTQSVHLHTLESGDGGAGDAELQKWYGSVSASILSLFQALTGGVDWRDIVDPLNRHMHEGWGLATVLWISFLLLAVMNIITGNFVQAAIERSASVKETDNVFQARRLFKSLDRDDSGAITMNEIKEHMGSPAVQEFFRTIDVDVSEAEVLFEILDISGDGEIDKEEFISGCLRLQGVARAIDLVLMTVDIRRGFEQIGRCLAELRTSMRQVLEDSSHNRLPAANGNAALSDGIVYQQ
eukprot:TRINITY_DN112646_c0_g1_i1.p1 TRINITY_DN112646_c0_g1~~TRINITY_DN112646_c0_g1_i1.p1  ORF type:complete len:675 (+),score=134.36 TRINITY_DN112646_c0_g1_i1:117-2141(+)